MELPVLQQRKPDWLKVKLPKGTDLHKFARVRQTLEQNGLHTICEEGRCPNIHECWSGGTATFLAMGDVCTRGCRFCSVKTAARGIALDEREPDKIALAVKDWGLKCVVITSVDRDDLPDQGSAHFAKIIRAVKQESPETIVEVLIPDFRADIDCLTRIVDAKPDVISHNIEVVERLQFKARDARANYRNSLAVLENVKKLDSKIFTKSSLMVGLGETFEEMLGAMDDLRNAQVDFLTIGQYLQPTRKQLAVEEFVPPERFEQWKRVGEQKGFLYVASGPFVRSSYKAGELFIESVVKAGRDAFG
ncbi:MAG: lipoyl synthase [Candidatus Diapherotrites archaeon]|nr:lipoyl synthase [Candidatus Diapherotrites archaeon]